jgi:uncharacterized membrane protein YdjX (TVP38/TMEM64 family)
MSQVRRALLFQVCGFLLVCILFAVGSRFFPLTDWIAFVQQKIMHLGAWSAVCYPLLYAGCNVLLLPGGVLSIGGGFFFGLWWGFSIILVGNVGGAAISFFISRWIGRRWLRRRLMRNHTIEVLEPAVKREGWKIILLSQLNPLFPTSLMNYLYGLTNIRFQTCILWIAIGQAPGLFLYAYLGTLGQLGLNLARGKSHPKVMEYWIWAGGLIASIAVLTTLGRISLRLLKEAENNMLPQNQDIQSIDHQDITNVSA